jgi:hypothetical protein
MRYKLSDNKKLVVEQVVSVMRGAGYAPRTVELGTTTLRGVLNRYEDLRTLSDRVEAMQKRPSYASQKTLKRDLSRLAAVYGLEVGLHLSRKGEVTKHDATCPDWPTIAGLLSRFDRESALQRLAPQREAKDKGGGRPRDVERPRALGLAVAALQAAMRQAGIEEMTVRAAGAKVPPPTPPGKRLAAWRKEKGWSQAKLGEALGYALGPLRGGRKSRGCPMVSHIERGGQNPGKEMRAKIERLTGIPSVDWFDG